MTDRMPPRLVATTMVAVGLARGCGQQPAAVSPPPPPAEPEPPAAAAPEEPEPAPEPAAEPEPEDPRIALGAHPDEDEPLPDDVITWEQAMALDGSVSTSIGSPNDGSIEGAVGMPLSGPGFVFNPRRSLASRYGTVELVQALVRAAAVVDREMPGSELWINDLGLKEGGPIHGHGSHQVGRDVDTLFYYLDRDGNPIPSVAVPVDPQGHGWDFKDLADPSDDVFMQLDVPRTWRFAQALIEDPAISINRIFVAEHVRTLLLAHARQVHAPAEAIQRFEDLTCQPSYPHDDHFHVRLFCTPEDIGAGCLDTGPIYPWHWQELQAAGVRPVRAGPRRRRADVTTAAQARAAAGEMDAAVRAFLAEREAWMHPHRTGRPYCR